jgi:hypothetical protein
MIGALADDFGQNVLTPAYILSVATLLWWNDFQAECVGPPSPPTPREA